MKKNPDLKFSTLKIKKIIQDNKEIGKIANMTPYVICNFSCYLAKSLEYFLTDLLSDCIGKAKSEGSNKIQPHQLYLFLI